MFSKAEKFAEFAGMTYGVGKGLSALYTLGRLARGAKDTGCPAKTRLRGLLVAPAITRLPGRRTSDPSMLPIGAVYQARLQLCQQALTGTPGQGVLAGQYGPPRLWG